jgi:uncharacterized coiled-coil DUF342 family protein
MLRKMDIARSWQLAREQFAALVAERDALKGELAEVRRERDDFRAVARELQAAVQARWQAEQRLARLYRERELARAEAAERNPTIPLH